MKLNYFLPVFGFTLCAASLSVCAQDSLKIATVDMKQVFADFAKTKEAEAKINDARNQAKKELEERVEFFKQAEVEARELNDAVNGPDLSEQERADKRRSLNAKLLELQTVQSEVKSFQETRERQITEQTTRSRNSLVAEINGVLQAKSAEYDLVFDKSGQSLNSVNVLVFSNDTFDITGLVLSALNQVPK